MFAALVFCVLVIATTSGDEKTSNTDAIEKLTSTISSSIVQDYVQVRTNESQRINLAIKYAVDKITPQLVELSKLMDNPSDIVNAIGKKMAQSEKMKKVDDAIATRSAKHGVNLAKTFLRRVLRKSKKL